MEQKTPTARPGQFLTFSLRKQLYGLPIGTVREINRVSDITPVPQTEPYVAGVMNLRGKVIPVIDLRLKFGLNAEAHTRETCIIVIEGQGATLGQVGMIVDSVNGVADLMAQQIEPRPSLGDDGSLDYITGMGKMEDRVIILVDIVRALGTERFAALSDIGSAAA